jgi:hypothetical protein
MDMYGQDPIRTSYVVRIDGDWGRPLPSLGHRQIWGWSYSRRTLAAGNGRAWVQPRSRQGPRGYLAPDPYCPIP